MSTRTPRATPAQIRSAADVAPPPLASNVAPPPLAADVAPPPAAPARKVRRTVDLTAAQHRALNRLLEDAAEARGWGRVNSQDMLATLVARLLADPELQRVVIAELPAPARRGAPR